MSYRLTAHAERRLEEMGLEVADVEAVLGEPELVRPGGRFHPRGRRLLTRGEVVVCVGDDGAIITVMWRQPFSRVPSSPAAS